MASEIQNLNPTILSAADLPTRLRASPSHKPLETGLFAGTLLTPADTLDLSPQLYSSGESDTEGDLLEEPIDEQEIYGRLRLSNRPLCRELIMSA